eukprot:3874624-Rhodomonas_salina.1
MVILSFDFSVMRTGILTHKEAVRRGRSPNAGISNSNVNVWQVKIDFIYCKVVECLAEFVEDNEDAVVGFVVNGKMQNKCKVINEDAKLLRHEEIETHNLLERTLS